MADCWLHPGPVQVDLLVTLLFIFRFVGRDLKLSLDELRTRFSCHHTPLVYCVDPVELVLRVVPAIPPTTYPGFCRLWTPAWDATAFPFPPAVGPHSLVTRCTARHDCSGGRVVGHHSPHGNGTGGFPTGPFLRHRFTRFLALPTYPSLLNVPLVYLTVCWLRTARCILPTFILLVLHWWTFCSVLTGCRHYHTCGGSICRTFRTLHATFPPPCSPVLDSGQVTGVVELRLRAVQ